MKGGSIGHEWLIGASRTPSRRPTGSAHSIDAEISEGAIAAVEPTGTIDAIAVTPAGLAGFVRREDSGRLTGAAWRVPDGHGIARRLLSYRTILARADVTRRHPFSRRHRRRPPLRLGADLS